MVLLLPTLILNPLVLDHFLTLNILKMAQNVILLAQELDFVVITKVLFLLSSILCSSELNLMNVVIRIASQLIDDALNIQITLGVSVDLLLKLAELDHDGAAIEAKPYRLKVLQNAVLHLFLRRVLHPLVHLFPVYVDYFGEPRHIPRELVRWKIEYLW